MYFWNVFIQEVHKQYVRVINNSVIICSFIIMLPMPFEGCPCFILKTCYPHLNFRSSCLIYIYHTVWERLSPLSFLCQSCEFVISSIVSPPSLNEVTGKDSTRCYSSNSESDGGKIPPSRTVTQISSTCLLVNWIHLMSLAFLASRRIVWKSLKTNNDRVVFLISVYLYCEPLSESRCASKDTTWFCVLVWASEKNLI